MESKRAPKKILVAVKPKDLSIVTDALGFEFDAVICHSLKEAQLKLDETISVILCGLRFDGGMIFDLLRHAKANSKTRVLPFYAVVESKNIFSLPILVSIQMAAKALGADGFINLFDLPKTAGEMEAYETLRQIIRETV